jgi:hypothetical protein
VTPTSIQDDRRHWWFLTRRFIKSQPMRTHYGLLAAMLDFKSAPNLVEDHPMNISGKFGSILFSGFREEDLNVKN